MSIKLGPGDTKKQERDLLSWLPWVLLSAMFAGFLSAAWRARFVMDEFALLQGAKFHLQASLYREIDPIKTVLATKIYSLSDWAGNSVTTVLTARLVGVIAVAVSLLFIVRATKSLWSDKCTLVLVLLTTMTFSNFFEHSFRIRTDTIALPLALGAFAILVQPRRIAWHVICAGFLVGCSFLCTQKAIYFIAAFLLAQLIAGWSTNGWRSAIRDAVLLLGGWLAAFLAYAVWYGGGLWRQVVTKVLQGPRYIFSGTAAYSGLGDFVLQTLERNVVPYSLCIAGLAISIWRWRRSGFAERFAAIATISIASFIFTHNQPWPYIFVWAQVFLALWVIPLYEALASMRYSSRSIALSIFLILAALSLPRQIRYFDHSNHTQLLVMVEAERLIEPESRYFDGIGMVVSRRIAGPYPWWSWEVPNLLRMVAALKNGDDSLPRAIVADHPKLWIINYRLNPVAGLVNRMIAGGYVRISSNILLTGIQCDSGIRDIEFTCRWPGRYQLFDSQGRMIPEMVSVDGAPPSIVVEVGPGVHRLTRSDQGQRFLLPFGTKISGSLPAQGPAQDLYAEVYTY